MRILIAEDDEALAGYLRQGLERECYDVGVAVEGEQASSMAENSGWDLAILDLNLPRLDGMSVLRRWRLKRPGMPVLVLTQRSGVDDRVECLERGADDFLAKPFSFRELSARIRALLRRSHEPTAAVLRVADLNLDRMTRRVERAGKPIELTVKEFALLEYLMRNANRAVTRAMILEQVWSMEFETTTNVVDVYINYVFAGTATQIAPYVLDATSPSGVRYVGNSNVNTLTLGQSFSIQTNLPGSQLFSASGNDMFQAVQDLITSLQTNGNISGAVAEVSNAYNYLNSQRVFYGNAVNQLNSQQTFLASETTQLAQQQNTLGAADLPTVISNLTNAEISRQAALEAVGSATQRNLFDYLR